MPSILEPFGLSKYRDLDLLIISIVIQQGTMRTLDASRKRWNVLYSDQAIGVDVRRAVKNLGSEPSPCEDGLRSVCWKVGREYECSTQDSDIPVRLFSSMDRSVKLRGPRSYLNPGQFIPPFASISSNTLIIRTTCSLPSIL